MKNAVSIRFLLIITGCLVLLVRLGHSQACADYYFNKGFGTIVRASSGSLAPLPKSGFLFNADTYNGYTITKLSAAGDTAWSKIYEQVNATVYGTHLAACMDRSWQFICSPVGNSIISIDTVSGQVLAAKKLTVPLQDALSIRFIAVTDNNDKIVLAKDESTYSDDGYVLLRLRADLSAIIWTKHIKAANLSFNGMKVAGNDILLYGRKNTSAFMLKANTTNGTVLLQTETKLDSGGSFYNVSDLHRYNNGYVALITNQNNTNLSKAIVRLNQNFEITKSYYLDPFRSDIPLLLNVSSNGDITGLGSGLSSTTWFFKITAADVVVFMSSSMQSAMTVLTDFKKTNDGYAYLTCLTYTAVGVGNFGLVLAVNIDANGNIKNCTGSDVPLSLRNCSNIVTTSNAVVRDTSFVTIVPAAFNVKANTYSLGSSCFAVNECNSIDVEGPVSLCGLSSAVYTGRRNNGCTSPVNWSTNSSNSIAEEISDSSVSVRFLQSGNYELYASVINGCDTIFDTIRIAYTATANSLLNLGPDRELCSQNTILLNATNAYSSYNWQNGSTDSTFLVNRPGTYYVTVTDACSNIFSDTVHITAAPPIPLSIGPDRTKCNNDTLQLSAPPGFLNYSWGPAYNLSGGNTQQVIVNPSTDTVYYLKAEKTPGCFGFDTVRITVNNAPLLLLGADVSFCKGDSAVADAGNAFAAYSWNTGATTQKIFMKNAGTYTVTATAANGCKATDSIAVVQVFSNPVVQLNQDTAVCTGQVKLLDAGNFNTFLWSTGATTRSISIGTIGTYKVTVTDANGCKGTDSSRLSLIRPLPVPFLGSDTSVCSYGTVNLTASGNFANYRWSTGVTDRQITIAQPGNYWLQVQDAFGCTGADSILVAPKECLTGFYIPNAFTPNNDGLNDLFRPFLFGNVLHYSFSIYNRMGELVFTTTSLQAGWNGTAKAKPQDPGIFVWKCDYQLAGEQPQQRKGTVVLIR